MDGDILDLKELEDRVSQLVDRGYVEEILRLQLSEFEMLKSMFPHRGELRVGDKAVLAQFRSYISGRSSTIPNRLDYSIHLEFGSDKMELFVNLPSEYPNVEPEVYVRSSDLTRQQQGTLNTCLNDFISGLDKGEICIYTVIAWLQENASQYFVNMNNLNDDDDDDDDDDDEEEEEEEKPVEINPKVFTRLWVYSHHIYSKSKRKEILDLAHEYNLTGFCLPGKPGLICVEGLVFDSEEWFLKVKSMNWKKIMLKRREDITMGDMTVNEFQKFPDFQEISFGGNGRRKDFHVDFGEFFKYLTEHGCEYIFQDYFGMEGR